MKTRFTLLLLLLGSSLLFAQTVPAVQPNYDLAARYSPKQLEKMVFSTRVDPHWLKNSERFWYMYETSAGKSYYLVDPVRRVKQLLFDNVKMAADMSRLTGDPFDAQHLDIEKLKFIRNETALAFEVKSKLVEEEEKKDDGDENGNKQEEGGSNRRGATPKMVKKTWHFEYDLATGKLTLLSDFEKPKEDARWATIAPDSSYVLFARDHNLYWMDWANYEKAKKNDKDTTIVENQLTTDGIENYSYAGGGRGETNVEEEKNRHNRKPVNVIWSPDSRKFATIRTDERDVKDLWVINSVAQPRPTLETYKYHMPGEKEAPSYDIMIFDLASKTSVKVAADTFPDQSVSLLTAPRLKKNRDDERQPRLWLSGDSNRLFFSRTSRDLKRIDICVADANTGAVTVLIEERLNTYVETRDLVLVNGGKEMIHWSERDGWAHFYLYDDKGNLKNQITSGPFHCEDVEGIDAKNRVLYFTANGREPGENPYYYHLYRINFDGTGLKLLTKGDFHHEASTNDAQQFVVNNFSRVNTTPASVLLDNQGTKILDLETADLDNLLKTGYRFPEPFSVKADDGITDLYGVMYKPFDFDSTKQYPIIEYVYPGPQTEAVNLSFSARMDRTDRLAQFGFIVITIGNRGGHPDRSKWYHNYGYGDLRDYGLADKKTAVEQLADQHAFIDASRVGIFGHSGGGFMSTAAMLVYPDFFKVAVSSSGNHENNIYNRWWSEKHHGVKEVTDDKGVTKFLYDIEKNPDLAKNLKGHLLISTGDIDNNVHPANTIRMANALIKANKRFDFFLFPGQRHGYGDMDEYFFWLRGDYFCKHLLGASSTSVDMLEMNRDLPRNK
ncbi:MAG: DPP IV N-terminal domain-containing protein [Lewinellaceae bacterium]|nr:DPP IV N-terminal domain-containing protein [Lewinellaceae bacterium]